MNRRGLSLLVIAVLLLVVPIALLGWLRLRTEDRLAELEPPPAPIVVTASQVQVDGGQQVMLSVTWGEPLEVVAPMWAGTVTGVSVASGDVVSSGDPLLVVDGVTRVAAATDSPFWRPLARGMAGDDVVQLQQLLSAFGLYDGTDDGTFGAALVVAVNAFAVELGVVQPNGVFDPGWVVWLPFEQFEVVSVNARLGGPAPGPGSVLLDGPATLSAVNVMSPEGRSLVLDGDWLIQIGTTDLTLTDGQFTDESLADLEVQAAAAEGSELFGRARRARPERVLEIPSTAVMSNPSGGLCVWMPDGSGYMARVVTVGGGRVARVEITTGLEAGDQVLANPSEILDNPTCP